MVWLCWMSQNLPAMAIGILEIEAAAASSVVNLHIFLGIRQAPVDNLFFFYAAKYIVELFVAYLKGVVVRLEVIAVVEVQGELVVHLNGSEMTHQLNALETQDVRDVFG